MDKPFYFLCHRKKITQIDNYLAYKLLKKGTNDISIIVNKAQILQIKKQA